MMLAQLSCFVIAQTTAAAPEAAGIAQAGHYGGIVAALGMLVSLAKQFGLLQLLKRDAQTTVNVGSQEAASANIGQIAARQEAMAEAVDDLSKHFQRCDELLRDARERLSAVEARQESKVAL